MTNGYVMAGGASSRFGRDKALVEFGGKALVMRACELVEKTCGSARVVAAANRYPQLGYPVIADRWPGEGPLGGIVTALLASAEANRGGGAESCDWNLIVSCDMPFLTGPWLAYLIQRAEQSSAEVVVPRSASGLEPLCACWRTQAAETLLRAFESGVRKVSEGIERAGVEVLDEAAWKRFDSAGRLFANINTAADYAAAQALQEPQDT